MSSRSKWTCESIHGCIPLGESMRITSCRGNIILSLENTSASRELVIQAKNARSKLYAKISRGEKWMFVGVVGGDISKGALALATIMDLCVGDMCQFYTDVSESGTEKVDDEVVLYAVKEGVNVVGQGLVVGSESGYIAAGEQTNAIGQHISNVPGSMTRLSSN